jgi:hypothetical protein
MAMGMRVCGVALVCLQTKQRKLGDRLFSLLGAKIIVWCRNDREADQPYGMVEVAGILADHDPS